MALELVVLVCGQAGQASRALEALKKKGHPAARNAVVLLQDRAGQIIVFETGDVTPEHGGLLGTVTGLLIGLLGNLGSEGIAAQAASLGFTKEQLAVLPADLEPGGSALVLLVETERVEGTLDLLAAFEGQIWQQALVDDLSRS
ncbi:MAG: hypothetical protein PVF47_02415 [Anaerolineae bacterium]|jgi:uncharacterized membrane protein